MFTSNFISFLQVVDLKGFVCLRINSRVRGLVQFFFHLHAVMKYLTGSSAVGASVIGVTLFPGLCFILRYFLEVGVATRGYRTRVSE